MHTEIIVSQYLHEISFDLFDDIKKDLPKDYLMIASITR